MKFHFSEFSVQSRRRKEIIDITNNISGIIERSGVRSGLVNIWVPHTTATIAVNEHDPDLWEDILTVMEQLVPQKGSYRHNSKYEWIPSEQNAHAHILNCLIKPCITLPVRDCQILLGAWQSILFIELDGPRLRTIQVHIIGE